MLYENFYYMIFTMSGQLPPIRVRVWVRVGDNLPRGQFSSHAIRLVKSGGQFVLKILCYIIRLIKIIIYMFRTQGRIKNPVKHLRWRFLQI